MVPVSAKARTGIDDLMEMILLVADLQELKANPKRPASRHGHRGTAGQGSRPGRHGGRPDRHPAGRRHDRRRHDDAAGSRRSRTSTASGSPKAGPATAAVVLGLSDVPEAGDVLRVVTDEKRGPHLDRAASDREHGHAAARGPAGRRWRTCTARSRPVRPRNSGSSSRPTSLARSGPSATRSSSWATDEVRINVLLEAAGDITDNDIMLATASDAIVVGFNTGITDTARRAAEAEGVDVRRYDIIYKLTDDIEAALKGLLEPEIVEVVEGRAEVRQVFRVGKIQVIAGSYVTDGRIVRGGARIWRGGKVIATDRIESLRRFRDDVREVATGFECGIGLANFPIVAEGDIIECFTTQTVSRVRPADRPPAARLRQRALSDEKADDDPAHAPRRPAPSRGDRRRSWPARSPILGIGFATSPTWRPRPTCGTRRSGSASSGRTPSAMRRSARSSVPWATSGASSGIGCASSGSRPSTCAWTTRPSGARGSAAPGGDRLRSRGRGPAVGRDAAHAGAPDPPRR